MPPKCPSISQRPAKERERQKPKASPYVKVTSNPSLITTSRNQDKTPTGMNGFQQPGPSAQRSSATKGSSVSRRRPSVRFLDPERSSSSLISNSPTPPSERDVNTGDRITIIGRDTLQAPDDSSSNLRISISGDVHTSKGSYDQRAATIDNIFHSAINRVHLSTSQRSPTVPLLPYLNRNLMAAAAARDARPTYPPSILEFDLATKTIVPSTKPFRGPLTLQKLQKVAEDYDSKYKREWNKLIRHTSAFFNRRGHPRYDVLKKPVEEVYADVASRCAGLHGGMRMMSSERCMRYNLKIIVEMSTKTDADVEGLPPMWKWPA